LVKQKIKPGIGAGAADPLWRGDPAGGRADSVQCGQCAGRGEGREELPSLPLTPHSCLSPSHGRQLGGHTDFLGGGPADLSA